MKEQNRNIRKVCMKASVHKYKQLQRSGGVSRGSKLQSLQSYILQDRAKILQLPRATQQQWWRDWMTRIILLVNALAQSLLETISHVHHSKR